MNEKIKCVSCERDTPKSEIHYTHRNGEDLPLCSECWNAAKQVFEMLRSPKSYAEQARDRWLARRK